MTYQTQQTADEVILEPAQPATAAVLWLHGLGADGFDFVPIVDELRLSLPVRFVFPHAKPRPVTLNNGMAMRAWYDIKSLEDRSQEDETGIRESEQVVHQYIQRLNQQGIASNRIVLAGFSQGAAMVLQAGLRHPQTLAGVMALSGYLPLRSTLAAEATPANREVPILMCHGLHDPVVQLAMGTTSRDVLQAQGYDVEWRTYPMAHQVCMPQIQDIAHWLVQRLAA